jgi:hypothetical protein
MTVDVGSEPTGLGQGLAQIAVLAVLGSFLIWLADGDGASQLRAFLSSGNRAVAAIAPTRPATSPCRPAELHLTGAFSGCAFDSGPETGFGVHPPPLCVPPRPGPDFSVFMHLQDATRDYLLYLQVIGRYHGPGRYQLAAWPKPTRGDNDQAARVAVREFKTGQLWESTAGIIRVDRGAGAGTVQATLQPLASTSGGAARELRISGPWRCD